MLTPNLLTLYVGNLEISTTFYEKLLDRAPVTTFPHYVSFEFDNGLYLSLWSKKAKNFVSDGTGHRFELSFLVEGDDSVMSIYEKWQAHSVNIEQPLHEAVFGLTFVATDPDGHRIRVSTPDE
ncbi:VOC family protein [Microbulbifer spongiae]|uniref:VOC family protein n=1 Tax=Microbulbifer spongiae TaxID=2944933 RepID=A0ABY9EBY2_9GAMM|nr:VOC family protein [Microbulbifer sp. MI-G]WKD50529.1 VOC family protein [Microbulbifer sp. MI-G]